MIERKEKMSKIETRKSLLEKLENMGIVYLTFINSIKRWSFLIEYFTSFF